MGPPDPPLQSPRNIGSEQDRGDRTGTGSLWGAGYVELA